MNRHSLMGAVALSFAFIASATHAQSVDASAPQEIIVTATRSARALTDVPVSASVVTSDQIQDTPAQSLDDVLRQVPGINLPIQTGDQAHPTADNVSMRGLGGIHALVMVDGVPINDPFFGYIQWGRIPLETIDHVEIVRGGGSPLWGNFATGGAINVITRDPTTDQVILDAGGGTYGTYRSSTFASYATSDMNRLNLGVTFNGTDGFQAVPQYARQPFDVPTSFYATNVQASDNFALADDLTGHFRFNYHENDQVLTEVLAKNNQQTFSYSSDVKKSFGDGASLTATVFHSDSNFVTYNTVVTNPAATLAQQTENLDNVHYTPFHNTGGSLVWSQDLGGWLRNYTIGADVNDTTGSDSGAIYDSTGVNQIRTDIGRGEELFLGGFAQTEIVPIERLEILASVRVQNFQSLNSYDGNPGGGGNLPNRSYTNIDPRISLRYLLTDQIALRGAYYQAFRAPTLDNLYRGFASDGGIYYPNADLKPETLEGGEIGLDFTTHSLRAQFTLYRTEISNLITTQNLTFAQLPPGFFYGGQLVNAASAQAQGIEAEVNWKIDTSLSARLGYTFADSVYKANPDDPASVGLQLTDVPRNTITGGLAYQNEDGWRIATDARWVSTTAWANTDHTDPGMPYQAAADSHFIVDLSGSYPILTNLTAYVQVQNLFDRRYIVNPGPYNPPEYGTPFEAFAGFRVAFN